MKKIRAQGTLIAVDVEKITMIANYSVLFVFDSNGWHRIWSIKCSKTQFGRCGPHDILTVFFAVQVGDSFIHRIRHCGPIQS